MTGDRKVPFAVETEPTVSELVTSLARDTGTLVRQEVQLAASEMLLKARLAGRLVALIGVGGACFFAGFLGLMTALIVGLSSVIPVWLSALAIGAVATAAGYGIVRGGIHSLREIDPIHRQAVETIKENQFWVKEQAR